MLGPFSHSFCHTSDALSSWAHASSLRSYSVYFHPLFWISSSLYLRVFPGLRSAYTSAKRIFFCFSFYFPPSSLDFVQLIPPGSLFFLLYFLFSSLSLDFVQLIPPGFPFSPFYLYPFLLKKIIFSLFLCVPNRGPFFFNWGLSFSLRRLFCFEG